MLFWMVRFLLMLTMVVNEVVRMVTQGVTRLADPVGVVTDDMTYQEKIVILSGSVYDYDDYCDNCPGYFDYDDPGDFDDVYDFVEPVEYGMWDGFQGSSDPGRADDSDRTGFSGPITSAGCTSGPDGTCDCNRSPSLGTDGPGDPVNKPTHTGLVSVNRSPISCPRLDRMAPIMKTGSPHHHQIVRVIPVKRTTRPGMDSVNRPSVLFIRPARLAHVMPMIHLQRGLSCRSASLCVYINWVPVGPVVNSVTFLSGLM